MARSRKSRLPRCIYCDNPGIGRPPLCRRHYGQVQAGSDGDGMWQDVFERVMAHPAAQRVVDHMFQRVDETVSRLLDEQMRRIQGGQRRQQAGQGRAQEGQARAQGAPPPRRGPRQPPPRSRPPEPPLEQQARDVLGFSPTMPLTPSTIKARRRELAQLFHPDRQGSAEAMRRVNAAADILLAELQA